MSETYDSVEIFPPIGISRAGDSTEYYTASEDPNQEHPNGFTFRGPDGKIKPSAVSFHAYLYQNGQPKVEATSASYTLQWTVNVANKKSAWVRFKGRDHQDTFQLRNPRVNPYSDAQGSKGVYEHTEDRKDLIIKPEAAQVSSEESHNKDNPKILTGGFTGSAEAESKVDLGKIWTDSDGHLVFLAGTGEAKCVKTKIAHPDLLATFDNDDWYDTLCDGNVTVTVTPKAGNPDKVTKPTSSLKTIVIAAPPKFTNELYCPGSLYDVMEDVYERPRRLNPDPDPYDCGPVFYDWDIEPIISGVQLLSWTNLKANEGHGPHKANRFPHELLSDDSEQGLKNNQPLRQSILDRVRAPRKTDDPTNTFVRNEQAHEYYMPRLGGDSGKSFQSDMPENMDDPNHRDRWSSLTELQYDRLMKWAQGKFKKTGTRFEGPETMPSKLTRAALKWTTGVPLFPGIEMYWVAQLSSMYNLKVPFRFHHKVNAGDLTKGLSLPWQADFFMCNTHWWPHIRPDEIVTEETWKKANALVKAIQPTANVPTDSLTKRDLWDEGLQKLSSDERVGSTELVKKWNKLGVISKVQADPVIFIETERTLVREGVYTIANVNQGKYIGCTSIDSSKRPVGVVDFSQIWHIKHIEPLRSNLYRLIIADFTAAADDGLNVNAHEGTSDQKWDEWVIEATATSGEYTIAAKKRKEAEEEKYWMLSGNATAVTVSTIPATKDHLWKITPYKPMYKILNSTQKKAVGCTETNKQISPIGVADSQTARLIIWYLDHISGDRYHLIIADYAAAANEDSKVSGHKGAHGEQLKAWVIKPQGDGYIIATVDNPPKYWTLANGNTEVTVAAAAGDFPNQIWKLDL
ncbi:hypothetical protein BYT27DRAFT_7209107 [Phlegmacium glaucopus]|nr:hypothetical protein BYT27DRAFT_7209107 [Phlegmacium glaucopus]